jgi:hypothetical protein
MSHIDIEPSPGEEAKSDRAAEKFAEVVHLVIRKVVNRSVRELNSLESASPDAPISKSPITSKMKKD